MKRVLQSLAFVFFLAIIVYYELSWLGVYHELYSLSKTTISSEAFRQMNVGESGLSQIWDFAKENELRLEDCLSVIMIVYDYDLTDYHAEEYTISEYHNDYIQIKKYYSEEYTMLKEAYRKIIDNLKYFPIPKKKNSTEELINYANSWGNERTYGGDRRHEGTDIMDNHNQRGTIPIISMTDGVVESMGWLELGGYRIGIRSTSNGYYYYAHLYSYAQDLKEGDKVSAGQLIGFMGDTGYSKVEGTTGNFDVHLHVGIYITLDNGEEISVNPYYILKNLERYTIEYEY